MAIYDAFISYSGDKPIAAALQTAIQKLGKPWYRPRNLRVFRDDTSLSATPQLWPSIEKALSESRFLILLASPRAAASQWVNREVGYWLDHKSVETLLIAVTDGALTWDNTTGDFASQQNSPVPPVLAGRFRGVPKWVDLRAHRDGVNTRDAGFLDAGADFAATIHGMPKEDLLSQELSEQRRSITLAWSAAAALAVLGAIAVGLWLKADAATQAALAAEATAIARKEEADLQRDNADKAAQRAWREQKLAEESLLFARSLSANYLLKVVKQVSVVGKMANAGFDVAGTMGPMFLKLNDEIMSQAPKTLSAVNTIAIVELELFKQLNAINAAGSAANAKLVIKRIVARYRENLPAIDNKPSAEARDETVKLMKELKISVYLMDQLTIPEKEEIIGETNEILRMLDAS